MGTWKPVNAPRDPVVASLIEYDNPFVKNTDRMRAQIAKDRAAGKSDKQILNEARKHAEGQLKEAKEVAERTGLDRDKALEVMNRSRDNAAILEGNVNRRVAHSEGIVDDLADRVQRIPEDSANQIELVQNYLDAAISHTFATRYPGGTAEDLSRVAMEIFTEGPDRTIFTQWNDLVGSVGEDVIGSYSTRYLLNADLTGAAGRSAAEYKAVGEFLPNAQPLGVMALRDNFIETLDASPELMEVLGPGHPGPRYAGSHSRAPPHDVRPGGV